MATSGPIVRFSMVWLRNLTAVRVVINRVPPETLKKAYSSIMIRNKTMHAAARLLLGAFIAAYAMTSLHVSARGTPPAAAPVVATAPVEATEAEQHCHTAIAMPAPDPGILLCKFHCQNAMQTLDYPSAVLADLHAAAVLIVPAFDWAIPSKPLVDKAFRPEATHHGGAPPPFASTARLRI